MTAVQRRKLLEPITILNYNIIHPVKRWAGVFVTDNFGENRARPANQRMAGMTSGDTAAAYVEPVTQFDSSFHLADFALWERMGGQAID